MTLVGTDYYPTSAYVALDCGTLRPGPVRVAAAGVGPQDGFSEYTFFAAPNPVARPRWGDYSATAWDGVNLWPATEYIAQRCTLTEFAADRTCGRTRGVSAKLGEPG